MDLKVLGYSCPCCGYKTFLEKPPGTYDICDICFWEDDPIESTDPKYSGGANKISLEEAIKNFEKFGACRENSKGSVRKPTDKEIATRERVDYSIKE